MLLSIVQLWFCIYSLLFHLLMSTAFAVMGVMLAETWRSELRRRENIGSTFQRKTWSLINATLMMSICWRRWDDVRWRYQLTVSSRHRNWKVNRTIQWGQRSVRNGVTWPIAGCFLVWWRILDVWPRNEEVNPMDFKIWLWIFWAVWIVWCLLGGPSYAEKSK